MLNYILIFVVGGIITTAIVAFEDAGHPLLSRLAALFPVFTWLSYLFISKLSGPAEVASHSKFVLFGTLFCWVPYMIIIGYFAPKIGSAKAIILAISIFLILAFIFIKFYKA